MEVVLRESKGLTPQAGGLPFKITFQHSPLGKHSVETNWFPSPYSLLHIPSQLKLWNFAEKKEVNSTQVIKKKQQTFIETQHDNRPLSSVRNLIFLFKWAFPFPLG